MRVAFITTSYPRTDIDPHGHFIARMAEGIAARGVEVSVRVPHESGSEVSEVRNGVTVHRFRYASESLERVAYGPGIVSNMVRDPRAALAFPGFVAGLRRATKAAAREADLLHVHWAQTAYIAGAGRRDVPMVLTLHGSDVQLARRTGLARTLTRPLADASAVIAVSRDLASLVASRMPAGREVDVVPVGVDSSLLKLKAPTLHKIDAAARLLFIARLVPEKGVFELVEAIRLLSEQGRDVHVTVLGVGPARDAMVSRLRDAGLAGCVTFLGAIPHDQALELMRVSDLVVTPSHREGCGLVPIEAAALGVPVVATRTGAMPEVVGCPEAVVEPRDAVGLAEAIELQLASVTRRRACARAGRANVRAEFTWDRIAEENIAIYQRVLGGKADAPEPDAPLQEAAEPGTAGKSAS